MSLSTTPSLDSSVRPSFASGYASPLTGGMAHPELWDGVVGAWCPSLGATGGTLRDLSGNHHHGTPTNFALTDWQPDSLTFNGIDYVDVPYQSGLALAEYTITAWIRISAPPDASRDRILARDNNGNYDFHIVNDVGYKIGMKAGGSFYDSPDVLRTDGSLQYVAGSYDGAEFRFFHDGVRVATTSAVETVNTSDTSDLKIGTLGGFARHFDGELLGVMLRSGILDDNSHAKLYRLGPAGIYQRKQPVITTAEAVAGLGIPIAAYHYNHNVGTRL